MRRVLLVAKVRPGGHRYYLEYVEAMAPDGRPAEEPGRWAGGGAQRLGLIAGVEVDDRRLGAVLAGRHPDGPDGPALGGRRDQVTVAGFDLSFCAPKSVSVLHGLGDDDVRREVRAGHEAAVEAARTYLEGHGAAVRRRGLDPGAPEAVAVPVAAEVVTASFTHRTSRALDPHLHTHVVVANLASDTAGTWSALDGRGLYAHRAAADALYHAHLRHELTSRIGVAWSAARRGRADIEGVGQEVRRAFSQRAAEIATELDEGGHGASRRAQTIAARRTRAGRRLDVDADTLRAQWRDTARDAGLSSRRLDAVLGRVAPARGPGAGSGLADDSERVVARVGALVMARQRGRVATFTRREVIAAVAASAAHGAVARVVEQAADRFTGAVSGGAEGPERPGVAERRHLWPERLRQRELDQALARRHLERGPTISHERGLGLG